MTNPDQNLEKTDPLKEWPKLYSGLGFGNVDLDKYNFINSLLKIQAARVREETIQECLAALPKFEDRCFEDEGAFAETKSILKKLLIKKSND